MIARSGKPLFFPPNPPAHTISHIRPPTHPPPPQLVIEPLRFWRASSTGSRFYGAAELTAYVERLEDKFGEGSPVGLDPATREDLEAVRKVLDDTQDWHVLTSTEPKSAKVRRTRWGGVGRGGGRTKRDGPMGRPPSHPPGT